jgi:Protein of unknown function (DUF5656)
LKRPPMRLSSNPSVYAPRGLDRVAVLRRLNRLNLQALLGFLVAAILLIYLLTDQRLVLVLALIVVGFGVDGLMRTHPSANLHNFADTAFFVSVPVLFTLGAGVFFRYTVEGFWTVPAAVLTGVALTGVIRAEYRSVEATGEQLLTLRLILNLAAYLSAFALYTALYNQRLPLIVAALLVGIVSSLIAVEVLRETEVDPRTLVVCALTLGYIMAATRWALNFISLNGWLGGVFILIVFYVASQLMQAHLWRRLDRGVIAQYSVVAAIGAGIVILGRVFSAG